MRTLASGEFYGRRLLDKVLANGLRIVENGYASHECLPLHSHDDSYVAVVLEGSFDEMRSGREERIDASRTLFQPAGDRHSERVGANGVRIFNVQLTRDFLARPDRRGLVAALPPTIASAGLASLGRRVYSELQTDGLLADIAIEAYVLEFLVGLQRQKRSPRSAPPWLWRTHEFLCEHFNAPPPLEVLAADAGVHPAHLCRAFRRHFRCTITEHIRSIRMARAEVYLRRTRLPLAEIALLVGYSDQSHFSSAFKRERGMSPAAFRANAAQTR